MIFPFYHILLHFHTPKYIFIVIFPTADYFSLSGGESVPWASVLCCPLQSIRAQNTEAQGAAPTATYTTHREKQPALLFT